MIEIIVMAYLGISLLLALLLWTALVTSKRGEETQSMKFRSSEQKESFVDQERQWLQKVG